MNICEALDSSDDIPRDKAVLVGNPGVGKSTVFQRFKTGRFVREQELTHHDKEGQEFRRLWSVGDQEVSITLFDTAGVERYTQTIPPTYYRRAKVVLLVYSIDSNDSFQAISSNWVDNISSADDNSLTIIVGNKCDLEGRRQEMAEYVPQKRALTLADNLDIDQELVFRISARTGKGFQEMFDTLAVRMGEMLAPRASTTQQDLSNTTEQRNQCRC